MQPRGGSSPPGRRAAVLLSLLGAALFGAGLGLHPIGRDEAVSVLLVRHPVGQVIQLLAAHEVHPAGYFLMLWAGPHSTPLAARLLSWLPAVGCIPLGWLAGHRLGLRRPWRAGLRLAASPFHAYAGSEARIRRVAASDWSLRISNVHSRLRLMRYFRCGHRMRVLHRS